MMRHRILPVLFLLLCLVTTLSGNVNFSTVGYHRNEGIPKAEYLWRLEGWHTLLRIVGGNAVSPSNHLPYQAGLLITLTTGWISICGGCLLSNTRVLTAAHCWNDGTDQARQFTVVLGSVTIFTGGVRIATTDVLVHPNWNPRNVLFDIAMLRFPAVTYTNNIQPVALPTMADVGEDFAGIFSLASGYGKTSDDQNSFPTSTSLYQVTLKIITNKECEVSLNYAVHGSHLCTSGVGNVGTCDGDSGGPLTVTWNHRRTLVGITSFGLGDGCQLGLPSVFTRITSFLAWIQSHM